MHKIEILFVNYDIICIKNDGDVIFGEVTHEFKSMAHNQINE